jgi:hypothetical protein
VDLVVTGVGVAVVDHSGVGREGRQQVVSIRLVLGIGLAQEPRDRLRQVLRHVGGGRIGRGLEKLGPDLGFG